MIEEDPWTSKVPCFNETPLPSAITSMVFPLKAHRGGVHLCSGTAVLIGPGLALTAAHVIDDFLQQFDAMEPVGQHRIEGTFDLQAAQISPGGESVYLWQVNRLWRCGGTDLALLLLSPTTVAPPEMEHVGVRMNLAPFSVGDRVIGFGYARQSFAAEDEHDVWHIDPRTTRGEVREVHAERRDRFRLPFPCSQVNARFDGAMSGGPAFDQEGRLRGLICSNLPPADDNEEHVSYVTTLWPLMALVVDADRPGYPAGVSYPALELVEGGFIQASGVERVQLLRSDTGEVTGCSWRASGAA